ncbi:MAG: RNA polymerase sigma factor [Acidobacteriota bacterium]
MDRASELALVSRLRAGDSRAFDEVYDAYRSRVFGFLVRLARNRDVADDLLEETWLKLVTHVQHLAPDTRLGPWLFTVARNLYWSYCRSRRLEEESAATLIGLWPVPSPSPSPFDEAVAHELDERVERGFALLPAMYREVLWLVAVENLTPLEAAHVCGVKPDALRQRLSRARAMLARLLDDRVDHSPEVTGGRE